MSILRRALRRFGRRGLDEESTNAVIEMLARRGVSGRAAADPTSVVQELSLAQGSRTLAVIELDEDQAPLRHAAASRIGGDAAGHMGRITVTGFHVTLDRKALSAQWPSRWATAIRTQPAESRSGLGTTGEFVWRPLDATGADVDVVVALLESSERVTRWVGVVLQEPSTMQVEVAPSASSVRVAAHQSGGGLPHPTTVEAVLTIARAIAEL